MLEEDQFHIAEKEYFLYERCRQWKEEKRELYIYGMGIVGKVFYSALRAHGISVQGFCVDAGYKKQTAECCGLPVFLLDELLSRAERNRTMGIIIAFLSSEKQQRDNSEYVKFVEADPLSLAFSDYRFDQEFMDGHMQQLEDVYRQLADEKSRQCMKAYFNQRISGRMEYLEHLQDKNKYYDSSIISLQNITCMIDCGAYDGDSYRCFCADYKQETGKEYEGMAVLLEPDPENYAALKNKCAGHENVKQMNIGAWSHKSTLKFKGDNSIGSRIAENGSISVEVDSIDHIISELAGEGKISSQGIYINMDIEGSELNALKGAEATIKTYHPVLAVCIYHKRDDFLTLPQYIRSLYAGYRLYLRAYERYSHDVVLYAVPY